MKFCFYLVVFLSSSLLRAQVPGAEQLAEAQRWFALGQYKDAKIVLEEYLNALKKSGNTKSAQALYLIGVSEYHLGQYDESLQHLTEVLDIIKTSSTEESDFILIETALGSTQLMRGAYSLAENWLRSAHQKATGLVVPNRELVARASVGLATFMSETKNYPAAEELLHAQINVMKQDTLL